MSSDDDDFFAGVVDARVAVAAPPAHPLGPLPSVFGAVGHRSAAQHHALATLMRASKKAKLANDIVAANVSHETTRKTEAKSEFFSGGIAARTSASIQ